MTWTRHRQQQQRGAQLHNKPRAAGEAPAEATRGREAQDHDRAALDVSGDEPQRGIDYPASRPADREGDPATGLKAGITPSAPEPSVDWDKVVQPERRKPERGKAPDDLPLPEGK